MMYTSKGRYVAVMFLLFTLSHGDPFRHTQRYNPVISPLSWHVVPPWEYILREIILKSVTSSPLDANVPHKRPLDASYYGGPIVEYSNDDENVILSRGNVYRLLNGHWMLCQDGCIDCEPCAVQRNPLFKWILQRPKQSPDSKAMRPTDLQLIITSQVNDHFHASSLWPNYYVYVTPQGERIPTPTVRTQHDNGSENLLPDLENSFSEDHHRSKNLWPLTKRDDLNTDRKGILREDNRATVPENVSIEKTEKEESIERKHGLRNMRPRHRPQPRPVEKAAEEANQLASRLILGTDQKGQKHLVHMVPADYPTTTTFPAISLPPKHSTSSLFVEDQATRLNNTTLKREKQTYQRIFRRVFDSLNTHKRLVENFLESPADNINDHKLSLSKDNTEDTEFSWNNRDINHKNTNFDPLYLNDKQLSFYAENEGRMEKNQQYRNKYGYDHMKQKNLEDYYTYQDMNPAKTSRGQSQTNFNFDLDRQRRRVGIKPYFVNNKNISTINSSVSFQKLDNYSINVIQKSSNGFVINPAKQIDLNDALIEKANNNSIESNSITTRRENGQLFGLKRQESGDVNREFEASQRAFRVIVATTELPVIRSEHETLNRTTVPITTSKTFANSS